MATASEALYFDNAPVAHVVAYDERRRVERILQRDRQAIVRIPVLRPITTRVRQLDPEAWS